MINLFLASYAQAMCLHSNNLAEQQLQVSSYFTEPKVNRNFPKNFAQSQVFNFLLSLQLHQVAQHNLVCVSVAVAVIVQRAGRTLR
jgi:hypothetical protein